MQRSTLSRHHWNLLSVLAAVALLWASAAASVAAQSSDGAASSADRNPMGWCCPANPRDLGYSFQCGQELLDDCLGGYSDPLFHGGDQEELCNSNCGYPPVDPNEAPVCGDQDMETDKGEECEFNTDGSEMSPTCASQFDGDYPNCDPQMCLCTSNEPECGNGAKDDGEECDASAAGGDYNGDGTEDERDALCYRGGGDPNGTCKSNCTCDYEEPEEDVCGDGEVTGMEECDYSFCIISSPGEGEGGGTEYYIDNDYTEEDCYDDGGTISVDNGCSDAYHYCDVLDGGEEASCVCTASDYCGDGNEGYDENGFPEECDDGNQEDEDGCSSTCEKEGCGNGYIDGYDECDDDNTVSGDGCSATCEIEVCGNLILDEGEDCEPSTGTCYFVDEFGDYLGEDTYATNDGFYECVNDGGFPVPDGDATCTYLCEYASCGNGIVDGSEQCDDGVRCMGGSESVSGEYIDGETLTAEGCTEAGGSLGSPEGGDGCDENCKIEACGNYVLQPDSWWPEACDDGGDCWYDSNGEEQSRPIDSPADFEMCIDPHGNYNGYAWGSVRDSTDTCDEYCALTTCGNAYVDEGEECDNGGTCVDSSGDPMVYDEGEEASAEVTTYEQYQKCAQEGGTVKVEESENDDGYSSCSATCKYLACGDGTTTDSLGEECDPGSYCDCTDASSECFDLFYSEDGIPRLLTSTAEISVCVDEEIGGAWVVNAWDPDCTDECAMLVCGDGVIDTEYGEECDDGSYCDFGTDGSGWDIASHQDYLDCEYFGGTPMTEGGDGCDAYCYEEICGNAYVDQGEDCDNGYCSGGNYGGFYINTYSGNDTVTDTLPDGTTITLISYERCIDGGGTASPGELYGCSDECTLGTCGDGVEDPYEDCDEGSICNGGLYDGDLVPDDADPEDCTEAGGVVETRVTEECSAYCETKQCGNYEWDEGEDCDDGSYCSCEDSSDPDCYLEGWDEAWLGSNEDIAGCEEVDGSWEPDTTGDCSDECALTGCGDAVVQGEEQCDDGGVCIIPDGGGMDSMEVNSPSMVESCLTYGGLHEDSNPDNDPFIVPFSGDGCDSECKDEVCGNAKVDDGEDCDVPDLKAYCDVDGNGVEDTMITSEADYDACWREAYDNGVTGYDFLIVIASETCDEDCQDPGEGDKYVYCCESGAPQFTFEALDDCSSLIIGGGTVEYEPSSGGSSSSGSGSDEDPADWNCDVLTDDDDDNDADASSDCPAPPQSWQCAAYNEFTDCRSCSSCGVTGLGQRCTADTCQAQGDGTMCTYKPGLLWGGNCMPDVESEACRGQLCNLSDEDVAALSNSECTEPLTLIPATGFWADLLGLFGMTSDTCIKGPMCERGYLVECSDYDEFGFCTACYAPVEDTLDGLEGWLDMYQAFSPDSVVTACPESNTAPCADACGAY